MSVNVQLSNSFSDRSSLADSTKSVSPSSSPKCSPRPSPRPQNKCAHTKSDTYLSVNNKDQFKIDGSPSSQEGSTSGRSSINQDLNISQENSIIVTKERKEGRSKKKSWFNSLYPTYKSRSEDFKRLFKDVPDDERLVVDYACALQKEILMQGRLYVTLNYLCFYANIFGWETNVTLKWKDVAAITKEKTALVIPNAVLICTKKEKCFFTSFVTRDKTYLMLFRVWQNALMDQPMSTTEMWQWVRQSYGDELGLTSDDEDYIAPGTEEEKLSTRSIDSFSEQEYMSPVEVISNQLRTMPDKEEECLQEKSLSIDEKHNFTDNIPTDVTDNSDSDVENNLISEIHVICTSPHEGRQVCKEVFYIHIDQLFTLLFTSSKFYLDFHADRKTTDLTQTPWTSNPLDNTKTRVVNLTMALSQTLGPKTAQVTETQITLPCSKPGYLYSIDVETLNAGIPYADSFYLNVHYCLKKVSDLQSSMTVYAQVKYKKSIFSIARTMIERNCWSGLDDFFTHLTKALRSEESEGTQNSKCKLKRRKKLNICRQSLSDGRSGPVWKTKQLNGFFHSDFTMFLVFSTLLLLLVFNVILYFKLWSLEDAQPQYTMLDLHILQNPPKSHDEWIKLLQKQENLHILEAQKWQKILKDTILLLQQAEQSLNDLQSSIHSTYNDKVISIIKDHQDYVATDDVMNNKFPKTDF